MKKYLTIAVFGALLSTSAHATCTIMYNCGSGTGTAPATESVASGATLTPSANTCTRDGYIFSHYLAVSSNTVAAHDGVAKPGTTYTIPFIGSLSCSNSITITLTAQWVAASGVPVVSAKSYTDAQLSTRQNAFTGSATDKLILFSDTTDGAYGERDIVTSLGSRDASTGQYPATDTASTANEVPTRGAIYTGLVYKQSTVTGTAGYVAKYDSNARMTGNKKPIYNSTTAAYGNALIEADTLNTAIADAVNSEFTQVDETGTSSSSGGLWRINSVNDLNKLTYIYLDSGVNGTGSCYKNSFYSSGGIGANDGCDATYYDNLNPGQWRVIFPDYNVDGNIVCSRVAPSGATMGEIYPGYQTPITGDYNQWVELRYKNNKIYKHCYCRMTGPMGSSWVYINTYMDYDECDSNCASVCSNYVSTNFAFRSAMFNDAQQ